MSYPDFLDDMESQLASYLGEDPSTFLSNENPTVSAPVDSLEESSYDANGPFTWDDFLNEEGIETHSPPASTWEWDPIQADFYMNEIVAPPTVDERSSEESTQSARQEEDVPTNSENENTTEQPITASAEPELQLEEDLNIPDDDPLFGGSTSDDIEVTETNEGNQPKAAAQETNSSPELLANTPQSGESATSAPITSGSDLDNVNTENDDDSLFGDFDGSELGDGPQPPENESATGDKTPLDTSTDSVDDLFGSEFGADFEAELAAELEAELKKDSANAAASAVPKHTGLHLPEPSRKVAKSQGLHLPDPPRAMANPQVLHLPAPPRKSVAPQGLHLPEPPRAAVNPQGLHLPEPPNAVDSSQGLNLPIAPPRVVADTEGLHLPSPSPAPVAQQSGVDTSAPEPTDGQEDEASTRRRRVRASRIPRSDMSQPKGRGQAGKVLTQLSGPAPSKLPDTAPSSSSGAENAAEKVTHLPRWAFGKYTNFGKPVAGSRYRKPNNSVQNPIPVDDEQESAEQTDEITNPQSQVTVQSNAEIVGAIDLTSDAGDNMAEDSIQESQNPTFNNGQNSTRTFENFQILASGNDMEFTYGDDQFLNSPGELNFPPVMDNAVPTPELQAYQSHSSAALGIAPPVAPQYGVLLPPPTVGDYSLYGQDPLARSCSVHPVQLPNVQGTDTFVHQSPYTMEQTGVQSFQPAIQQMQTGNYEQENAYGLGDNMIQATPADIGGSHSLGLNDSRPTKRLSHERAEYSNPRVLMTYGEFRQIFPQELTRGCFEVAIQNERAADTAIVARGGIPPQRPTIRKSIICTWTQVQHLNRIRAANGEKLFEPKPNAHKRPEAFKESLRRKRQERGEISESEESDTEPEAKRLRLAQEPMLMAQSSGEQNGERSSQIRPTQPSNPQGLADVPHLPPSHGIPQAPHPKNMGQAPAMHIHQPVAQSAKRKMVPEQWERLESAEQEMEPTAKRPRNAAPSSQTIAPVSIQSMAKQFQDYVSERQSEYLKFRVPELRKLCNDRGVIHPNVNGLMKGGLVGVLVGQDVSLHPVYSQMHHQAQAKIATGQQHPTSGVGRMGRMNPPTVAVNRTQQQIRAQDRLGMRQDRPGPNSGPVNSMGSSCGQQGPLLFRPTPSNNANRPRFVGNGNAVQPLRIFGRAQQLPMSRDVRGLANNSGQSLGNMRQPPVISQPSHVSLANQDRENLYAQSRLPVSVQNSGYNHSGIQPNVNGGRNNHTGTNAQIPAYGIAGDFGTGIYPPAIDDRRRKPRIQGQDAPSRVPRGNQRSFPQPAMNNTAGRYTAAQQPMLGSASLHAPGHHPANTLGSQIPRPAHSRNMGGDPQSHPQGARQQHGAAQNSRPPYYGPPQGYRFNGQRSDPAPPR
ncbi:uncharacterized protein EAE97_008338 [Botrytis byssoidea]|uniref:Uncharacterized protein n=1 Tax=Botrytis byssoidea TaxID=139641 RepID=A0A9P5LUE2_9HELO|nr:uncharacterized protein EAE97_008338 [Botrytis byssoidea]KAF7935431.1 hypothetical protein EAE97_008338 [Botrytis byssoidea]